MPGAGAALQPPLPSLSPHSEAVVVRRAQQVINVYTQTHMSTVPVPSPVLAAAHPCEVRSSQAVASISVLSLTDLMSSLNVIFFPRAYLICN